MSMSVVLAMSERNILQNNEEGVAFFSAGQKPSRSHSCGVIAVCVPLTPTLIYSWQYVTMKIVEGDLQHQYEKLRVLGFHALHVPGLYMSNIAMVNSLNSCDYNC